MCAGVWRTIRLSAGGFGDRRLGGRRRAAVPLGQTEASRTLAPGPSPEPPRRQSRRSTAACARRPTSSRSLALALGGVRSLVRRPSAQDDVAGEEALVVPALASRRRSGPPARLARLDARRAGAVARRRRRRRRLLFLHRLRFERPQPVLVVAHAVGIRRRWRCRRPSRVRDGAFGRPATKMITSMPTARPTISQVCMLRGNAAAARADGR